MKIKALLVIIVGILIIISLSRSLRNRYQRAWRLEELQTEIARLEEEHLKLENQKMEVTSEGFLEKEARDKLQMTNPGEKIVILPENTAGTMDDSKSKYGKCSNTEAVWRQWLRLFFPG